MKSAPASMVGILGRLPSTGVFSRQTVRHGHTMPRRKQPRYDLTGFKPGLGEHIWVHHHITQGMIIYTHEPELPRGSNKALSQIPFTVKKQKPAELRRDYWAPLCLIEVPKGLGVVGRSVMQKLREFRHRHELEWGWQAEEFLSKSRRERGKLIHNQRANAVADIAAVLGGAGRGNKMWAAEPLPRDRDAEVAAEEAAHEEDKAAAAPEDIDQTSAADATAARPKAKSKSKAKVKAPEAPKTLVKANIYWSNDADHHWASEWSENVTHSVGLPKHIENPRFKTSYLLEGPPEEPEEPEEPEAAEGSQAEETAAGSDTEPAQEKPQSKRSWLGWLGGGSRSSSLESRV